jgi:F0F1-type ATP synthase assembly protein I
MSERSIHLVGWTLFILSALFFIASSLRAGDMVGVFGGVLFLLGCLVFVVHMLRQSRASASRGRRDSGG